MNVFSTPRLITALRLAVSAVALFVVIRYIGLQDLFDQVRALDLTLFSLVVALLSIEALTRCVNWHQLARSAGSPGSIGDFVRGYFTGGFVATVLPSSLGTDVARSFFVARRTSSPTEVILAAAFAVNFLSLVASSVCAQVAGLVLYLRGASFSYSAYVSLALSAAFIVAAAVVLGAVRRKRAGVPSRASPETDTPRGLRARLGKVLDRFVTTLILAGSGSSKDLARTLAVALATCVFRVVGWTILLIALGAEVSWASLFVLGPALLIAGMLPISIGGFGGLQALTVLLLADWGVTPEAAVAWSLLQSSLYVAVNLPGAVPFMSDAVNYKALKGAALK